MPKRKGSQFWITPTIIGGIVTAAIVLSGLHGLWREWWVEWLLVPVTLVAFAFGIYEFLALHKRWRKIWAGLIAVLSFVLIGGGVFVAYKSTYEKPAESKPVQPIGETNAVGWLPPELPPGCTNVVISFGGQEMSIPILWAEISPETNGTKFAKKDLTPEFLKDLDKMTNYSPRQRYMWLRWSFGQTTIGNKTVDYPSWPFIRSNRLFVDVKIPFQNERRIIQMDDDFDHQLQIPRMWDRNYNSNSYEIVTETTNPVLQVIYKKANKIQVNGVYLIDPTNIYAAFDGWNPTLLSPQIRIFDLQTTQEIHATNVFVFLDTNKTQAFNVKDISFFWDSNKVYSLPLGQKTIFKYPSWKYPGVLNN